MELCSLNILAENILIMLGKVKRTECMIDSS